jgi:amino acid transporter
MALLRKLKTLIIGGARDPQDQRVFHAISLVAFFAWVGLGADGLSSSCYGPPEAFKELQAHPHLALLVGLATAVTVLIVSASYSQIVELFPSGGGGYLVASKLLSPRMGMISGCALLIDYVLTISVSIASGADALFSLLPEASPWHSYKLAVAIVGVVVLTVMNLRGVKESVIPLVPIFLVFLLTHVFAIVYAIVTRAGEVPAVFSGVGHDVSAVSQTGHPFAGGTIFGPMAVAILILQAYSMGAGTFTGIEAISNGMPVLREPRVRTARHTMVYMAASLAFMAFGLMVAYVLCDVTVPADQKKTANAVLFQSLTAGWNATGAMTFSLVTLVSEGAILFVAAQTGFLDGPRVISYMAVDRWFPSRFAVLSDRLVTQNGIVVMGVAALAIMLLTGGSVTFLLVLYAINVFITFCLSQLGMVRHWWISRRTVSRWRRKLAINGTGLMLCAMILVSVSALKFHDGGWITFLITGSLVVVALLVRRHYNRTFAMLHRLDELVAVAEGPGGGPTENLPEVKVVPRGQTAVLLVSGFNGMGLHTLFAVIRMFGSSFKNYAFVQVGVVDAGNFKGHEAIEELREHLPRELDRYVQFMRRNGYYAEAFWSVGVDMLEEIDKLVPAIQQRFGSVVFFGGQLVFPRETFTNRLLHNYVAFVMQRRFYQNGIPFMVLPIRVQAPSDVVPAAGG